MYRLVYTKTSIYFLKQTWKEKLPRIFFVNNSDRARILLESALVVCWPGRLLPAASCRAWVSNPPCVWLTHDSPGVWLSVTRYPSGTPACSPPRQGMQGGWRPQARLCHSFLLVRTPSMECPPPLLSTQKFNPQGYPTRVPGGKGWERKRSEDTPPVWEVPTVLESGVPTVLRPYKPFSLSQNWHFGNTRQCWLFVVSVQIHTTYRH